MIVGLLHFYKAKRQAVYKQGDLRTELILTILAGKLCREMEIVVLGMVKVYQANWRVRCTIAGI